MSLPVIRIEVAFQTTAAFGEAFILNNPTLGQLNYGGGLSGFEFVDVTSMATIVSFTRGRNRNTEQFNAGTASVSFRDPDRLLDPLNTASPYYPFVLPRQPIKIYANDEQQFSGLITGWDRSYDFTVQGDVVTAQCSDPFTVLANMAMDGFTPGVENTGERINTVLNLPEVSYQGPYYVDFGQSELGAFAVNDGTNVLSYFQNITASEAGWLFMSREGVLTFLDRHTTINPVPTIEFTDAGGGVPYQSLTNQFGDELLFNAIQMQSPAGAVQTATDTDSVGYYQAQTYSKLDLLNSTTSEVQNLADAFLGLHSVPLQRFTGISIQLAALASAHQTDVLAVELVDTVDVTKSFSTGTPSSVTQRVIVSGIAHAITPGSHTVSLTFENIDQQAYLTLADTGASTNPLSQLDYNALAF